jgi:hypothetical protein
MLELFAQTSFRQRCPRGGFAIQFTTRFLLFLMLGLSIVLSVWKVMSRFECRDVPSGVLELYQCYQSRSSAEGTEEWTFVIWTRDPVCLDVCFCGDDDRTVRQIEFSSATRGLHCIRLAAALQGQRVVICNRSSRDEMLGTVNLRDIVETDRWAITRDGDRFASGTYVGYYSTAELLTFHPEVQHGRPASSIRLRLRVREVGTPYSARQ